MTPFFVRISLTFTLRVFCRVYFSASFLRSSGNNLETRRRENQSSCKSLLTSKNYSSTFVYYVLLSVVLPNPSTLKKLLDILHRNLGSLFCTHQQYVRILRRMYKFCRASLGVVAIPFAFQDVATCVLKLSAKRP